MKKLPKVTYDNKENFIFQNEITGFGKKIQVDYNLIIFELIYEKCESVKSIFKDTIYNGFNQKVLEKKENIYKSKQMQPLGHTYKGFQQLGKEILNVNRTFGKQTEESN